MNHSSQFRRGLELRRAEIDRLPLDLKAALAAACTQRQMEVYGTYARRTGTSAAVSFSRLLDAIWDKIRCRQSLGREEHLQWQNRAERLYPGEEATPDIYQGCAQIAVLSLLHSNNILWTEKADDACSAAHEAFSSIFNFLTSPIGPQRQIDLHQPNALQQAFAHSLIEAEHHRQQRDLLEVEQALLRPDITGAVVDELRRRSTAEAKVFLPIVGGPRG